MAPFGYGTMHGGRNLPAWDALNMAALRLAMAPGEPKAMAPNAEILYGQSAGLN